MLDVKITLSGEQGTVQSDSSTVRYFIEEDSLIGDQLFKKVKISTDRFFDPERSERKTVGYIREENGLVTMIYSSSFRKDTMYNFNLEEGDIFKYSQDDTGLWFEIYAAAIDTVFLEGEPRKRYEMKWRYLPDQLPGLDTIAYDFNVWVEGIGDIKHGVLTGDCSYINDGYQCIDRLLCYQNDGRLIYQNPDFNTCFFSVETAVFHPGANKKPDFFYIYPNQSHRELTISLRAGAENTASFMNEMSAEVIDQTGRLILQRTFLPTNFGKTIDIQDMKAGFYLLLITNRSDILEVHRFVKK